VRGLEAAVTALTAANEKGAIEKPLWLRPFTISGFVQGEYQSHQDSEDALAQGGALLNKDRFVLRRGRVRVDGQWQYAHVQLEVDGNTQRGPQLRVLHGFATLKLPQLHDSEYTRDQPLAAVTMGLFDTPFGSELTEGPRTRWFMERSLASQSLFPGEPDVGIRFSGALYFLRWSVAAMNGEPLEQRAGYSGQSPKGAKDVIFKVGADTHPRENLQISANVSGLRGKGFHPGADASKGQLLWRDSNEDGQIQPSELIGQSATAATPSQTFSRWALGVDVQARLRTRLGLTTAVAEAVVASNLDRGAFVADPVVVGIDVREAGFMAGVTQEIARYGVLGFRYDYYDPNSDFFDKRSGRLVPSTQSVETFSPLAGLVLPDRGRLLFQYDISRNHFARDLSGQPVNLKANAWTLRLQVEL
jgi:hypothetical protein